MALRLVGSRKVRLVVELAVGNLHIVVGPGHQPVEGLVVGILVELVAVVEGGVEGVLDSFGGIHLVEVVVVGHNLGFPGLQLEPGFVQSTLEHQLEGLVGCRLVVEEYQLEGLQSALEGCSFVVVGYRLVGPQLGVEEGPVVVARILDELLGILLGIGVVERRLVVVEVERGPQLGVELGPVVVVGPETSFVVE